MKPFGCDYEWKDSRCWFLYSNLPPVSSNNWTGLTAAARQWSHQSSIFSTFLPQTLSHLRALHLNHGPDLTPVCHHNRLELAHSHLLKHLARWINVLFKDESQLQAGVCVPELGNFVLLLLRSVRNSYPVMWINHHFGVPQVLDGGIIWG